MINGSSRFFKMLHGASSASRCITVFPGASAVLHGASRFFTVLQVAAGCMMDGASRCLTVHHGAL